MFRTLHWRLESLLVSQPRCRPIFLFQESLAGAKQGAPVQFISSKVLQCLVLSKVLQCLAPGILPVRRLATDSALCVTQESAFIAPVQLGCHSCLFPLIGSQFFVKKECTPDHTFGSPRVVPRLRSHWRLRQTLSSRPTAPPVRQTVQKSRKSNDIRPCPHLTHTYVLLTEDAPND